MPFPSVVRSIEKVDEKDPNGGLDPALVGAKVKAREDGKEELEDTIVVARPRQLGERRSARQLKKKDPKLTAK